MIVAFKDGSEVEYPGVVNAYELGGKLILESADRETIAEIDRSEIDVSNRVPA